MSPWIVNLDALEQFEFAYPKQIPEPLPYLQFKGNKSFDINLEVAIQADNSVETVVTRSNFKHMN